MDNSKEEINSEQNAVEGSCDNVEVHKLYIDNCVGVLREVPTHFDFGTLKVILSSLDISPNFISIGSRCGALFLFNREHGLSLKPLRTTYNEVCTCQSWFSREEQNFLAIGHQSGTLILICIPSGKSDNSNRKLKQSIHENAHKGHEIVCIQWSVDGRNVYSCDITGLILCVRVNFDQETYTTTFVYNGRSSILFLQTTPSYLIAFFSQSFIIFELNNQVERPENGEYRVLTQLELPQKPIGVVSSELELVFLTEDAKLIRYQIGSEEVELDVMYDLNNTISIPSTIPEIIIGGIPRDLCKSYWAADDFKCGRAKFYDSYLLINSTNKICLLERQQSNAYFTQLLLLDLRHQLKNSDNLEILDSVYDKESGEVFVLTSTQKLIRIGNEPSQPEVIVLQANKSTILSSISSVAQKSSQRWFQKFALAGEFQEFEAPIQLPNLKLPERSAVIDEYGSKLANNLTSLIETIKQQNPLAQPSDQLEVNTGSPASNRSSHSHIEEDEELNNREQELLNPSCLEPTVQVKRKPVRRSGKSSVSQTTSTALDKRVDDWEDPQCELEEDELETSDVCVENLDRLLGVLGVVELPYSDPLCNTNVDNADSIDKINDRPSTSSIAVYEASLAIINDIQNVYIQRPDNKSTNPGNKFIDPDNKSLHTPSDQSDQEEDDFNDSKSIHLLEQACQKQSETEENEEDESLSTSSFASISESSSTNDKVDTSNAEYPLVTRMANQRTDVWNRIKLPYNAVWFDVCSNYMVICSNKKRERPQYRLFESVDNGILGGGWTELKYNSNLVAVNDTGNLLWRVESGIALAPHKVDTMSPFSNYWLEQANEGRVEAVALTTTNAWYLTSTGPCVQMSLPEMGIFFHAESPFQLSQIAASEHAVWALRAGVGSLVVRVGLKHCPMGTDWVENNLAGPNTFVSIALHEHTGFGLDTEANLWICNGVDVDRPFGTGFWHQTCSPLNAILPEHRKKFIPISQWRLKVSFSGVFISVGKAILSAQQPLTAHSLYRTVPQRISLNDNFGLLTASAFTGFHDYIYVCQPNSEIYAFSARHRNLTSLPTFNSNCPIVALTAARDCLYVLDSCGVVHIRDQLNSLTPRGKHWLLLSTKGLFSTIISFAASAQSLWAVTTDGCIWHSDLMSNPSQTNWNFVDTPPNIANGEKLDQVRCSPSGKFVWVIATATNRMWARCDISEAGRQGRLWSETCNDIKMAEVTVADNAVYGLSISSNQLYRLRSMSSANPAGLYWKPMPLNLRAISVDAFEQRLWGIDFDNRLVKHQMQIYPRSCLSENRKETRESDVSITFQPSIQSNEAPRVQLFQIHEDEVN